MFVGDLAIALNLLSVAVLAFAISVACISIALRLTLPRFEHLTFRLRKVILWALVTVPWWVAISCAAFFWPRQQELFSTAWLNEFAHWHHVDIFSFSSWHAFTLLSAFGYLIWSMISTIYVRKKQSSTMASLIGLSEIQPQVTITQQRYYSLAQAIPAPKHNRESGSCPSVARTVPATVSSRSALCLPLRVRIPAYFCFRCVQP